MLRDSNTIYRTVRDTRRLCLLVAAMLATLIFMLGYHQVGHASGPISAAAGAVIG